MVEAGGEPKVGQNTHLDSKGMQCCAFNMWHKLMQSTKEAKTAVNSLKCPINALQGHEMDPCGLTASVKSRL